VASRFHLALDTSTVTASKGRHLAGLLFSAQNRGVLSRDLLTLRALDRHAELGTLILRLFFAFVLVYGTQDNVFHRERMLEFRDFVARHGFPYPLVSAYLSAYAQFICGLLIGIGLLTRLAALTMIINFIVALAMVHVGLPFASNISALAMLFCGVFFLLHGPGAAALDRTRR
jgi:putative oxidoreductase